MVVELREIALEILEYSWPMLVISIIIAASFRIAFLIKTKEKLILHQELFNLAFIIYVLCLFHAVTFQDVAWSTANYIPFKEIFRYDIGSALFLKNIFGNIILFLPLGFFLAKYTKIEKPWVVLILVTLVSISIEVTQGIIGRVFDIDDIILNVIGGVLGFLLYKLFSKLGNLAPRIFKNELFLNIVSILLVGGFLWFLIR